MGYRLVSYTKDWESAVGRANARLSGVAPYLLPERAAAGAAGPVRREHLLVVDADDEVRGGCLTQSQPAWVDGAEAQVVNVQSPLSEGLADRKYAGLAPWLIREMVRLHPFTYSIGMGGVEMPYPRLLKALGWRVEPVPFYFRVLGGRKFLANMQPLRKHPKLGWLAVAGGAMPLLPDWAFAAIHASRRKSAPVAVSTEAPDWIRIRSRYGFAMDRTPEVLDALYPRSDSRFVRLHVAGAEGVLRGNAFRKHPYFGDLFVATLVEGISLPGAERELLRAAIKEAQKMGAALLVTNQTAPELTQALDADGWLPYASNFLVALSPALAARVGTRPIYVNRGDGDGLLNL
jgi:hypothetical protein